MKFFEFFHELIVLDLLVPVQLDRHVFELILMVLVAVLQLLALIVAIREN